MCWSNGDPYQMWSEETPPASQDPVIPAEVDDVDEFKGLDWTDLIDDSKERYEYELELRRNATMNDHSYANPTHLQDSGKGQSRNEPAKKGIQGNFANLYFFCILLIYYEEIQSVKSHFTLWIPRCLILLYFRIPNPSFISRYSYIFEIELS